ncbi:MAG: CopG family ribbon-helix-helix protein [Alphaproteobacteria bacterium]
MASTTVTVRISQEVKEALGRLARATDRTGSHLAGKAIADYVARELAIVEGVAEGLDDAENGRLVTHDAAMKRVRNTIAKRRKSA